jgi:zinc protease
MRTVLFALTVALASGQASAQDRSRPFEEIRPGALRFDPPEPRRLQTTKGVEVLLLEDHTLPLVSVFARFRGGPSNFPRTHLAASSAVPGLLRSAGTISMAPDSVDRALEFYAAQTTFGGGGESSFASLNTLTEHLEPALQVWFELLKRPGFDSAMVEVWRGQAIEGARRRADDPGSLAISQFNRLMYGDHPIGWDIGIGDLAETALQTGRLREVHGAIFCPQNMTLGIVGDLDWATARPLIEEALADWPDCAAEVAEPPLARFETPPGLYLIEKDLPQSTVIVGKPSEVRLSDDKGYFASRIGNSVMGASGFTSRLMSRLRTERGYAYSAASVWTTPRRSQGILGAVTQTKSESTVAAIRLIREILEELTREAPDEAEVQDAIARISNGFVFNFQDASRVVSRQMLYLSQGLPLDWLQRYLEGIRGVKAGDVLRVIADNVASEELVILVVGDPDAFDEPLETLGPVTRLEVSRPVPPREAPRFQR